MTTVSPFEANLLRVLRAILGRGPAEQASGLILGARTRPTCLSRDALKLIQDTLARGCVRKLADRSGWPRSRFLRGGRITEGRLWDRTAPSVLGLSFSKSSLEFLIGLVGLDRAGLSVFSDAPDPDLTLGDRVLIYFAYSTLRDTQVGDDFRQMVVIRSHALCRLAYPGDFAESTELLAPDFATWADGPMAWVLEALQDDLARAWVATERAKRTIEQPARMVAIGVEQSRVAGAYLDAIDAVGRRDLARFFLQVARELLIDRPGLGAWTGGLRLEGLRLADRAETLGAALAAFGPLERLRAWEWSARGVGYFDDGYPAAVLGKSDWERHEGDTLSESARALFRSADPLASGH